MRNIREICFREIEEWEEFLVKAKGHARPREEVKHIAYYKNGNIHLSYNTKKIVEKYLKMKKNKSLFRFLRKNFLRLFYIPF